MSFWQQAGWSWDTVVHFPVESLIFMISAYLQDMHECHKAHWQWFVPLSHGVFYKGQLKLSARKSLIWYGVCLNDSKNTCRSWKYNYPIRILSGFYSMLWEDMWLDSCYAFGTLQFRFDYLMINKTSCFSSDLLPYFARLQKNLGSSCKVAITQQE